MEIREAKIGEEITIQEMRVVCIESADCDGCIFNGYKERCTDLDYKWTCSSSKRKDRTNVKFVAVADKKIKEPQNEIVINGVHHIIVKDTIDDDCSGCSLQRKCHSLGAGNDICVDLFNSGTIHFEVKEISKC